VAKDDVVDDGRNRSPEFLLRTVLSGRRCARCSGMRGRSKSCPGGAPERGDAFSTERRNRAGGCSPETSLELVGLCGIRSSLARSLVAEEDRGGVEMNEEGEGLL
jgi:hypothetical protein